MSDPIDHAAALGLHYVDKAAPDLGFYEVFVHPTMGARWHWTEVAKGIKYEDQGPFFATKGEAYRDAADDWESNGNSSNRRLSGQLRAAATRADHAIAVLDGRKEGN